uniref:Uncharacterized protein n=1 Tax=Utricularia reniformis TaxID=192314 RepID=A0A1Y0B4T1_9LAMI|nr:hypothetical protein AEK19_MT2242 [Utricularia reniformis]ART32387.1 hypothetical protein AEK19_MT2242 [Utricularia reniformis]
MRYDDDLSPNNCFRVGIHRRLVLNFIPSSLSLWVLNSCLRDSPTSLG